MMERDRKFTISIDSTSFLAIASTEITRPPEAFPYSDFYNQTVRYCVHQASKGLLCGWGCVTGENDVLIRTISSQDETDGMRAGWLDAGSAGTIITSYDNLVSWICDQDALLPVVSSNHSYSDISIDLPKGRYEVFVSYPHSQQEGAVTEVDRRSKTQVISLLPAATDIDPETPDWLVRAPRF